MLCCKIKEKYSVTETIFPILKLPIYDSDYHKKIYKGSA